MDHWLVATIAALALAAPAVLGALLVRARRAAAAAAARHAELAARAAALEVELAAVHAELERMRRQRHELLANLAHDLRTPLAVMQGHLELLLLRRGQLDAAEQRSQLQTAVRHGDRLARLIGDLFDLSRLEAGELAPQREDFSIAELVQDIVHQHGDDARLRGVELRGDGFADAPGRALRVSADMALVSRVLDNLLDNALRHTPCGGTVTVCVGPDGTRVALAVCDTGSGISADDLPALFERYERTERVGPAQADGHAGLGLAIARRIVRLHGSDLAVASHPGEGTRVAFHLPRAEAARMAA